MALRSKNSADPTRQSLDIWKIAPGSGWRLKSKVFISSELFIPLVGLGAVVLALGLNVLLIQSLPAYRGSLFMLQGLLMLGGVYLVFLCQARIRRDLMTPLSHLRNWALRMRGGNLSYRDPKHPDVVVPLVVTYHPAFVLRKESDPKDHAHFMELVLADLRRACRLAGVDCAGA